VRLSPKYPSAAVVTVLGLLAAPAAVARGVTLVSEQGRVGKHQRLDLVVELDRVYDNPFDPCEVQLDICITDPDGQALALPAFFGQDYERRDLAQGNKTRAWYYPVGTGSWKARLAPMAVGLYTAWASVTDQDGQRRSEVVRFACVPSDSRGFLRAGGDDPRFLEFSEGRPFFAIGQNLAFIGEGQYVNVPKAERIFAKLAANGANFLRIWTCCEDWALAIEAPKSAWTRSWTKDTPVVFLPDADDGPGARRCVKLEGGDGASLTVSPSHPVALRPQTRYVVAGRFRVDGPRAVRLRVGDESWELSAQAGRTSDWQAFREEFVTGPDQHWLGRTEFRLLGEGTGWFDALSLKEADGGAELLWEADVNRAARGYYNPLDCFMLDEIVDAAEEHGIYLMLCLLTRDLYMSSLSDPDSDAYDRAIRDAKRFMRYVVARWGYSTSVAAWEYWNEMDPGKPTGRFYAEVGDYLERIDVYRHLRTTSTWHPSAGDCRHPKLDIAQAHHYMRPGREHFKDEVGSVVEPTRFLREHAPNKPALIGEFGLATDKWGLSDYMKQDTDGVHFHNCLWASAFAGSSGTAMFWWWDQLDRHDAYRHYRPLSAYLEDVSLAGLRTANVAASSDRFRVLGYQGDDRAYLWLVDTRANWWDLVVEGRTPESLSGANVEIAGLHAGRYAVTWWDTHAGAVLKTDESTVRRSLLTLAIPTFSCDIACKIEGK
jgi:hypothetical protein